MSDSVTPVLNHAQGDWFGASMYDYVHPEDQVTFLLEISVYSMKKGFHLTLVSLREEADFAPLFHTYLRRLLHFDLVKKTYVS